MVYRRRMSIAKVRAGGARRYAAFHHCGALEGRAAFVAAPLDRFAAVIADRAPAHGSTALAGPPRRGGE
jgi:hypothetical protein